ncbi:sensor histidine kinase [Mucilaginibacter aquariorum]|uniref:histidine kinase n=1 Tax=Mucilaginibacter aquariorum TaxID=2967225 RepID=A0ABT1T1V8_9SPHI|nr:HAMP domain-containing histidine kinase [Mucilaginibacter aquariorum]
MKKRLRFTFIIATITVSSIVLFQLYWLYYTFNNAQRGFHITAVRALEKSIDLYQSQQVELPTSLNYKKPSLTVFMRAKPSVEAFDLDTPKHKEVFKAEFNTVAIDKQHEPYVRALIARLMTQQMHKPLDLNTLAGIYEKELAKDGIVMPVILTLRKQPLSILPNEVASRIDYYKSPVVVIAKLSSSGWMIRHNLLPAIVSFILILLSAGSLWYMGVIIRRQLKLDRLKNDFISNITHELRTPLTILRSSNEAIARFGVAGNPEKLARYTGINADIIDKLEGEVERIMDISMIDRKFSIKEMKQVDLNQLLENLIRRFDLISNKPILLTIPNRPIQVNTDPYKIETILNNLLDNAKKYAGDEARISVEAVISHSGWQLLVSDNGHGISTDNLLYIFDKYYRVENGDLHDVKGYGLGLSHVKGLVESLNGKIIAKSKIGHGTTFTITFPV